MNETAVEVSIFDRLGGEAAIDRLVKAFYDNMDMLPQAQDVREMHGPELGEIRKVFKRYLTEWTGGPKLYSPEKGHPRLRQRHMGFRIGDAERDAWLTCMRGALEETVTDADARAELDEAITKLADWMRNVAAPR